MARTKYSLQSIKYKLNLIEKMGVVFENIQAREMNRAYSRYFRQINADIASHVKAFENINQADIDKIARKYQVDISFIERNMNLVRLQAEIEQSLLEGTITMQNANEIVKHVEKTGSTDVRSVAKINPVFMRTFMKHNQKYVGNINQQVKVQFNRINREIKEGYTSRIFKKYKAISNRATSFKELERELRATFKESRTTVDRILRTEIHAGNERTKLSLQTLSGYKYKVWHTEGDKKVRDTHRRIDGMKIDINKQFRVGRSLGDFPGDPKLAVGERVNCRCFLTFEN